ncbi:MAG: NAD(P)-binding domain-containing protein [Calditrichaceae bacterium]|nr:NAD(P)-binding domain-containing protein [Calditrichaceae bacterium]
MESNLIWIITIAVIAVIFLPYAIKFRKSTHEARHRREEAIRLGADKPMAQYPSIDQLRCIGCGACVAACPEGDVLGVVMGKAVVINGLKCVGHGRCAEACPVEGITVGLGDISIRDDIPLMSGQNETNIPGLYIAGELGGLALIRNAINQGKMVIDHIKQVYNPVQSNTDEFDVIIIGAGPAGMSAALQAKKLELKCLLIDQQDAGGTILQYPRKKLVMTKPVEIPLYGALTKPEYSKEELLEIWLGLKEKYIEQIHTAEKLIGVNRNNGFLKVTTDKQIYLSQNVILALGRRGIPRKLNVTGEDLSKVMYKLMDAEAYQNENLLVVGGGDSAIEAAMGLARQKGNKVILSYRKDKFFRIKKRNEDRIKDFILAKKIEVLFNSDVERIAEKSVLIKDGQGVREIPNDYVFIFAGGEPPFELLKKMGIQFGGN